MQRLPFISHGRTRRLPLIGETDTVQRPRAPRSGVPPQGLLAALGRSLRSQPHRFSSRFGTYPDMPLCLTPGATGAGAAVPTETLIVEGARLSEIRWACRSLSLEVIDEGRQGRVLLRSVCEGRGAERLQHTAAAARRLYGRGEVAAAHPNLLRLHQQPGRSRRRTTGQWALANTGVVGACGADVAAHAAWTLSRGRREIGVAVLDDGVSPKHAYLRHAISKQADFAGSGDDGRPDGDDAHGTACAGIIAADGHKATGLATGVSLIAARIATSGGRGFWISDDFATAEAIDWCWDEARADVLNLSWGGGPPADAISRALARAVSSGRGGLGCVVVAAAGNTQSMLDYPASVPAVIAVGASNQWDQRKTRASRDGEEWWGSNYGENLSLLAPGVSILTTDLPGRRGSSSTLVEERFNGTSAAAPFVSATAALMLSLRPGLSAAQVRRLMEETAEPIDGQGRTRTAGHGRLQAYAALRRVQRLGGIHAGA